MRGLTSGRIADLVHGRLVGRHDVELAGVAPLNRAGPGELSFLSSRSYIDVFRKSRAGAVLLEERFSTEEPGPLTRIVVSDVRQALALTLAELLPEPTIAWGVSCCARIGRGARWLGRISIGDGVTIGRDVTLGAECVIGAYATIEDGAAIGNDCRIGVGAVVGAGARLGDRVVLHPGARIGGVGYAYAESDGAHVQLRHVGGCYLEDDVEVGANTTIDRGSIDDTVVGAGTKIDNLVQIAHNVRIGKRCLIMAQVGLAGSTFVEDDAILAGQAGLAGHLRVGRGARVAAQAGVIGDVPAGATVSGYPARSHREVLRQAAALGKLARITTSLERIVEADGRD